MCFVYLVNEYQVNNMLKPLFSSSVYYVVSRLSYSLEFNRDVFIVFKAFALGCAIQLLYADAQKGKPKAT